MVDRRAAFPGLAVYSAFFDQRKGRNEMWAAPASWHFGAELCKSTDMGKTWDQPENRRIKMPKTSKKSLENIWQSRPEAMPIRFMSVLHLRHFF
jgi:hypothetical protein